MNKNILIIILMLFTVLACSGAGVDNTSSNDTTVYTSNGLEDDTINVGTVTGNPSSLTSSYLSFSTVSKDEAIELDSPDDASAGTFKAYCEKVSVDVLNDLLLSTEEPLTKASTHQCSSAVKSFSAGIVKFDLDECLTEFDDNKKCQASGVVKIGESANLFTSSDGLPVDMTMTATETKFSEELNLVSGDYTVGGGHAVVAYVGFELHDENSDADEAEKINPRFRGKKLRICTTPNTVDLATKSASCGGSGEEKKGDLIGDLNDDGIYGFIVHEEGGVVESATRPKKYINQLRALIQMSQGRSGNIDCGEETDFEDYHRILIGFNDTYEFNGDKAYHIAVEFLLDEPLKFIDGFTLHHKGDQAQVVCLEELDKKGCPDGVSDTTVGVYYPNFDTLIPRMPKARGVFEEITE
jgi:hypothetical protein